MGNQTCIKNGDMYVASDGRKFEPAVRKAMAAVFSVGATPYLRKLESEMAIQRIEVCPETFVQTLISYDSRNIYETTRTGEATVTADRKHFASEYGVWDFKFDTADYFKEDKRKLVVPGTTYIEACPECEGIGVKTCPQCNGNGKQSCSVCGGTGFVPCPNCEGEGHTVCKTCNGNGTVISKENGEEKTVACPDCGGSGVHACSTCSGNGRITCKECEGSGRTNCRECKGVGKVKCKNCKGFGNVVDEVEVSSDINVKEAHNIMFMSSLREDMVPFFTELKPEFDVHQVAVYESSDPIFSISTTDFNFRVRETIFNTGVMFENLEKEINSGSGDVQIKKYRVKVFQRIFLKITYSFNDKVYLMFYDCGENKSFLTANPYNDVLQRLAEDIRHSYERKDYPEVAAKITEYRSLRKINTDYTPVRNDPEAVAASISDRFTLASALGILIPLIAVIIFFSKGAIFSASETRTLIMWSIGFGLGLVVAAYRIISKTWTSIVRHMSMVSANLAFFGTGLLSSALIEGIIAYIIYLI